MTFQTFARPRGRFHERRHERVDDALREAAVEGRSAQEQPVVHGSEEHFLRQADVDVRAQVAAFDASLEHLFNLVHPQRHHPLPEGVGQL